MSDIQLSLTQAERECLVGILERVLKETRIEEHRTRAPTYREHVVDQEQLILSVLTKLGQPPK
jgi:hypothetical protein